MPVRCLENRVFAITCNRTGSEARGGKDQLTFIGNSEVVTPKGAILQRAPRDQEELHILEIDPADAFARYGLDSAGAAQLAATLQEVLGRELPATLFYDYPSPRDLAKYLSGFVSPAESAFILYVRAESEPPATNGESTIMNKVSVDSIV